MIERYQRKVMAECFKDARKFDHFLAVEIAALKAFATAGIIPKEAVKAIEDNASFDVQRIQEIEAETHHDVIAFTRSVSESLGPEKRWFHYGLTSTDVVDTAWGLTIQKANRIIEQDLLDFIEILKQIALKHEQTLCVGRTHGIHAEMTTFGLKFALYYDRFQTHLKRFRHVRKHIEVGKLSGAVGNFVITTPKIQDDACQFLGLGSATISTQVLPRDIHAEYMSVIALIASGIEQIAVEIRHLMRTEVAEVKEAFKLNQKGSSAMPHKQNPIASENMTGCARLIRGYMHTSFENIALWHERDISHSSVERVIFPDALMVLDYMLNRYKEVLSNLVVDTQQMLNNSALTYDIIYSQKVLHRLIDAGMTREAAYDLIQPLSNQAYTQKIPFKTVLLKTETVLKTISADAIEDCFSDRESLKNVGEIYRRVGLK